MKDKQPALCRHLAWDSEFWGYPVARLEGGLLRGGMEQAVLDWCHEKKIRCLYFSAEGADAETLQRAYQAGFQFVDVRTDLELPAFSRSSQIDSHVKPATEVDLERIQWIARRAHLDSRFFKDLNFDRQLCEELYTKWIERDFVTGCVWGYFPEEQADVGGYITFSKESQESARIGLIAVEEFLRGRGVGGKLLDAAILKSAEMGAKKIRVATQGTNVAALKLYEKAGFRVCDVKIWFHKWFDAN